MTVQMVMQVEVRSIMQKFEKMSLWWVEVRVFERMSCQ